MLAILPRAINGILTASYWEIGRRLIEFEQGGKARAEYGEALIQRLATDLIAKAGRGFSERNLRQMRALYLGWAIRQTPSAEFVARAILPSDAGVAPSGQILAPGAAAPQGLLSLATAFPLPWSHFVRLLSVENLNARRFYDPRAQSLLPGSVGVGKRSLNHASQRGVSWATVPAA